ncbi:endonuclease [Ureibacillus sp. FSL K6-8385]|uniref:Endonuclease n=1 Tax=Ureibacillus terrenus TaxID=118246 RepID=A0A540V6E3_9BACL|nr:endonuclease [Ureibacillus terrenus]MED3660664.1 endonuclease [Ureibacillus terrenus]MED3762784.1 endonuclease [Ureibacillus terrenus]TQE92344.1 endonuclease [Ureibacillus terrenus]
MNRFQFLISQLDCLDELMTARFENERAMISDYFFGQIVSAHQKVSLAEKNIHVKNTCSPFNSELE